MEKTVEQWVVPLFKGDAKAPKGSEEMAIRQRNEVLITGNDPVTGLQIERARYIEFLTQAQKDNSSLVQNVGRVAAAALDGATTNAYSKFVAVEGCEWDWGLTPRYGADIDVSILNGVIPTSFRSHIIQSHTVPHSSRTIEELTKVMQLARKDNAHVDFYTHEYHADRSRSILQNEVLTKEEKRGFRANVFTPQGVKKGIQHRSFQTPGDVQFLYDIINASEPSVQEVTAENKKEKILTALMRTRQLTFGVLDPEWMILQAMKQLKMR